jgi:diguanylate cyclase (GGDEF)-like protein
MIKLGVRQKVLLLLMSILLIALSVSGWFALQAEKERIIADINQRGTDISRFVAKSLAYSVIGYDYHTIDLLLNEITISDEIGYAKVVNKRGSTMSEYGERRSGNGELIIFEEKILIEDEVIGTLTLGLSTSTTFGHLESQKFSLIKREAFIILLIALGEFLALSYIIIRPVSIISESLDKQKQEDGQIVGTIPVTSNDEFGELANRFNQLGESLNAANAKLQSRAEFADEQLIKTNLILQKQSEELQLMNEEFRKLSITDPLTGLFNRRHFEDVMKTEIDLAKRHGDTNSLILIDIDHFKKINDTYGHEVGDIVIKKVADIMRERLRKTDVLCRIGGEEFISLCKRADKDAALELSEGIRNAIGQREITVGISKIPVTVSIGVATVTRENIKTHADNLFRYTDYALYKSKQNGRNKVTHFDDLEEHEI